VLSKELPAAPFGLPEGEPLIATWETMYTRAPCRQYTVSTASLSKTDLRVWSLLLLLLLLVVALMSLLLLLLLSLLLSLLLLLMSMLLLLLLLLLLFILLLVLPSLVVVVVEAGVVVLAVVRLFDSKRHRASGVTVSSSCILCASDN
jgi:hypothetical protein